MDTNRVITGDCLEELEQLEPNSVEAIVTDPPYGLAFMGRSWDDFEPKEYQEWCEKWAAKAKRVLKPGGHMLAFSGNRTHHRLFSGIQDAGYEIRDTVTFHYGSGFPKALDVSKAIDKQAGAEREVVGKKPGYSPNRDYSENQHEGYQRPADERNPTGKHYDKTAPATDAAEKWDGFKTALKPATEFVCMARKPLGESTVAENVQTHGTGALNIDGTRIGTSGGHEHTGEEDNSTTVNAYGDGLNGTTSPPADKGRYPSNVVFDETEAERLDRENGETGGGPQRTNAEINGSDDVDLHEGYQRPNSTMYGGGGPDDAIRSYGDCGGPSRYFYTSKATKAERTLDGKIDNPHPTVKPTDLMEWLVTLVTAENQTVLDPFCGSGTTGIACKNKNRDFLGIEQNADYADIARARIGLEPEKPDTLREDNAQTGFENY